MSATVHEKLKLVRQKQNIQLPRPPNLSPTYVKRDGTVAPLVLRNYQLQMVVHLMAMRRFIVGDDTGLGKCVTPDTLIDTNQGLVPIGSLQPDPYMVPDTFEGVEGWEVRIGNDRVPVRSFYFGGSKPTRRVLTRYGFEVEGSLIHPLLSRGSEGEVWRQTQQIEAGDFLCVERREAVFPKEEPSLMIPVVGAQVGANAKAYPVPDRLNPPLARLLGYIVGEAWSNNPWVLSISQSPDRNPEAFRDIRNLLYEQMGWESEKEVKDTRVWSVFLRRYLEYMGVDYVTAHDKRVPDPVLRGTRDSVREFLRGLFEGEAGAIGTGGIEFTTASERLGREVQLLLLRFGIVANRSPKLAKGYDHTYWRLTLFGDDARRFGDEIGFVSPRKRERLAGVLPDASNPNHDVIPFSKPLIEDLREPLTAACIRLGWRISTRWGTSFYNTMGHVRHGRRNPTYRFLRQLLDVCREVDAAEVDAADDDPCVPHLASLDSFQAIERLISQHYFYDPVVEVVEGFKEVVDIEVDDPRHCFTGNGLVNHNTVETIASLCYLWSKEPDRKVLILTKKSSVPQWETEIANFTVGVNTFVATGTPQRRLQQQLGWLDASGPSVLIQGYTSACNDFARLQDWEGFILVCDECTVFKNPTTRVHKVARHLAARSERCWGLTATLIKNNLMEGYGIYRVVVPDLFRMTSNAFMNQYTIVQMQTVKRGRRVPKIVGYRAGDIERFRDKIDFYYLGRPKHAVADELPVLTTRDVLVDLTAWQEEKYAEALTGLLEHGDGELREYTDTIQMTKLIYCQEIVNHPGLIEFPDYSSTKLDALVDLVTDGGDLHGEKVIVFTRFKKMVDLAIPVLEKAGIKCVRVTGDEKVAGRKAAMDAFQDPNSDTQVIWITMAGGDAINLQAAKALVFFDTPWSAGDYLQILGRMIRIGSEHDSVYALHLVARGTIDEHVQAVVKKKMKLIEKVLGERVKGEKGANIVYDATSEAKDLIDRMISSVRTMGI